MTPSQPEPNPPECKYFYYDLTRRLPCLEGCQAHQGRRPKCLKEQWEHLCEYPVKRCPEVPALAPEPVKWCPGPGGCIHFNYQDYTCALRKVGEPRDYMFKYKDLFRKTGWSFTFSGKYLLFLGIAYIGIAVFYINMVKGGAGFLTIFHTLFGIIVAAAGYLLHQWETKTWGAATPFKKSKYDNQVRSSSIIEFTPTKTKAPEQPPKILKADSEVKFCAYYYYDENNRLPCLEGCQYPKPHRAKCLHTTLDPDCWYPRSRRPVIKALMPRHVHWCPGPGGCEHFREDSYSCALKLKNQHRESAFILTQTPKLRIILKIYIAAVLIIGSIGFSINFWRAFQSGSDNTAYISMIWLLLSWFAALVGWIALKGMREGG